MIINVILLGLILFVVDLFSYPRLVQTLLQPREQRELAQRLPFTLALSWFMQTFFALIFIYTFRFMAILKALESTIGGGLFFAYLLFLPMLYMIVNNLLWTETKRSVSYINIMIWGLKLTICGLFVVLVH